MRLKSLDSTNDQTIVSDLSSRLDAESATERSIFYQNHLNRVSRSFAFCIARLEGSLREHVALGYLICRILDTIEDANWPDYSAQEKAFLQFDRFISSSIEAGEADSMSEWVLSFPPDIPEGEALLLQDAPKIFSDFHSLPSFAKDALLKPVQSMSAGMRHFMARKVQQGGRLKLKGLSDVNRYCFFVAGVVGEMLTRLIPIPASQNGLLADGIRFGLFLQKVNILKDQRGDEREGRYLVPSRSVVRASLKKDGEAAFRYLLNLPDRAIAFRLFCAWSFFLGLASLPWIEKSFTEQSQEKIPRDATTLLLSEVEQRIHDKNALEELFNELQAHLQVATPALEEEKSENSSQEGSLEISQDNRHLLDLYQGQLGEDELLRIFNEKV